MDNKTIVTSGSPFVVGRPLRANERIFGRDEAFHFIGGELARFSSVNIVGERRMGKTSLLNHLMAHQKTHLVARPDQPSVILARFDLQGGVSNASRFYGVALREILGHLPPSRSAEARQLAELHEKLQRTPEANYDEFDRVLHQLHDSKGICVRPVIVVDEFEHLLEPSLGDGFPYPHFYNGIRSLMGKGLVAMVVASRRPLAEYFSDPARPGSLTSTFPTYFVPFVLSHLDGAAADALLLQPSDHTLSLAEVAQARRRAGGHPCHLQVAGEACYQSKAHGYTPQWIDKRFKELKAQNCMVSNPAPPKPAGKRSSASHWLRTIFLSVPVHIGRQAQRLGGKIDDMAAWLIGAVLIILVTLLLLGVVTGGTVLNMLKRSLGIDPQSPQPSAAPSPTLQMKKPSQNNSSVNHHAQFIRAQTVCPCLCC
jgi:AAA domain